MRFAFVLLFVTCAVSPPATPPLECETACKGCESGCDDSMCENNVQLMGRHSGPPGPLPQHLRAKLIREFLKTSEGRVKLAMTFPGQRR